MPTKRKLASVVCSGKDLVVAGGKGVGDTVLTTVEVMDTDTLQWSIVSSRPVGRGVSRGFARTPLLAPKRLYIHCYSTF